ncbi:fermentative D-lactate dehydrogenase, NAD-dependent [uncultured Dysgonomonas sp.]|uniref:Fermentative D-lactate dehydrogenase, NAD-dependent n=1 Tax=uncultured Dysgonomonas sp. TaxID=206096 RepID=A0A212JGL8_9BACT|nr:2-hydroxyacid dehydrogenase [uncultured Dysgonomonas sp.]SBV98599.1 fermentative D-lactate dehydrogenase, NAD-dependent [uncultured Dysgonomonas sp.]
MAYKIAVFDAKPYDRVTFDRVNEKYGFELTYHKEHLDINNVVLANGADAVCIFVNAVVDSDVVAKLKSYGINLIALRCAGFNNVDVLAAEKHGVKVVRVPDYSPHAIAEHTLALMLCLNRKVHRAFLRTRDGNFSLVGFEGFDMYGKTVGVIGTGKIGKVAIGLFKGLGMNVLAYDLYPDNAFAEAEGIKYVTLDELYANSDIITLHCPLTKETEYLICDESINKMKDGVMIVNTGRGKLIHTRHLIDGLLSRKIGYAGLDVYEEEGAYFYEDHSDAVMTDDVLARLLSFNNVIVTSHQAFFTQEAMENIANTTMNSISDFFAGKELKNQVVYKA